MLAGHEEILRQLALQQAEALHQCEAMAQQDAGENPTFALPSNRKGMLLLLI